MRTDQVLTVPDASTNTARALPRLTRFRWAICGLLFLATTINYVDRQILALLKPMLDTELGWTNEFAASLFNSGTNVAAIIAPAFVPWVAFHFGWQMCFIIAGVAGFGWLVLWLPLFRNSPRESRRVSAAERELIERDQPIDSGDRPIGWLALFAYRQTWAIVLAKFLTDPVWWFFLIWLPDFFKKTRGLDLKNSWVHLVAIYAIATVLSLCGGWLSGHLIDRGWSVTRARKTAMFGFALSVVPVVFAPRMSDWSIAAISGIAGMAGAVGGIIFPKFSGALLDHYKLTAGGESAGYVILLTMCGSAYIVAFAINHMFAPRFEAIQLPEG